MLLEQAQRLNLRSKPARSSHARPFGGVFGHKELVSAPFFRPEIGSISSSKQSTGFNTGHFITDFPMRSAQPPQSATWPHGNIWRRFRVLSWGLGLRVESSGFMRVRGLMCLGVGVSV